MSGSGAINCTGTWFIMRRPYSPTLQDCGGTYEKMFEGEVLRRRKTCRGRQYQLVLPDGMGVSEARDYLVWKLNREIGNYVADECARHFFD